MCVPGQLPISLIGQVVLESSRADVRSAGFWTEMRAPLFT